MITQEIVASISGSRVQTNQGLRRCAGNAPVAVGDTVTVVGGLIVGWVRRTAQRPPGTPAGSKIYFVIYNGTDYIGVTVDLSAESATAETLTITNSHGWTFDLHARIGGADYFMQKYYAASIQSIAGAEIPADTEFAAPIELNNYGDKINVLHGVNSTAITLRVYDGAWTTAKSYAVPVMGRQAEVVATLPTAAQAYAEWTATGRLPQVTAADDYNPSQYYYPGALVTYGGYCYEQVGAEAVHGETPGASAAWSAVGRVYEVENNQLKIYDDLSYTRVSVSLTDGALLSSAETNTMQNGTQRSDGSAVCYAEHETSASKAFDIVVGGVNYGHASPGSAERFVSEGAGAANKTISVDGATLSTVTRSTVPGSRRSLSNATRAYYKIPAVGDGGFTVVAMNYYPFSNVDTAETVTGDQTWFDNYGGGYHYVGEMKNDFHFRGNRYPDATPVYSTTTEIPLVEANIDPLWAEIKDSVCVRFMHQSYATGTIQMDTIDGANKTTQPLETIFGSVITRGELGGAL